MNTLTLPEGIVCLDNALEAARGHLDEELLTEGANLLSKVRTRRAEGMEHTVVAFAGSTGSGKSSLLNAVVGEDLAPVAARRPTTSRALAVTGAPAEGLTRWLGVDQTVTTANLPASTDSQLVLVDLPDIDSAEYSNREIAQHILMRADLIVWVADPQKYADSVWHDDYLRHFTQYGGVSLVAFNQCDRLEPHELPEVLAHLDELFSLESFSAQVIPTSALTGQGIRQLQEVIGKVHDSKQAAVLRLAADLRAQGDKLVRAVEAEGGEVRASAELGYFAEVSDALLESSGATQLAEAAATSYQQRGKRSVDWVGTAWLHQRADPLGSGPEVSRQLVPAERQLAIARSSIHRYSADAAAHLPRRWRRDVVTASEEHAGELARQSSTLVSAVDLGRKNPAWWAIARGFQMIMGAVALAGLVWLIVLWVAAAFHVQFPDPPMVGPVGLPTVLLVVGLAMGVLGALVSRWLLGRGARRTSERVERAVGRELSKAAESQILAQLIADIERYGTFVSEVRRLQSVGV